MIDAAAAIAAHAPRAALQFSGGRDSLAMLLTLRHVWDRLTVYFCNSGDNYPETQALVKRVRGLVPNFVEVQGDAPATIARHGWATDLAHAGAGWQHAEGGITGHIPLIDRYFCCYQSIMLPLHERMRSDGMTLLLRGQRQSDEPKSHVRSGETHDGMLIVYPIEDWSTAQVEACIREEGFEVPPFYAEGARTASDCMHCTAWLEHNSTPYLAKHYPAQAAVVIARLHQIKSAVAPHMARIDQALEMNQ